ncbi:UNVERIFIED_CONTAM: hypothetical protein K2H54_021402 [Gekko kuhli]
MFTGGRQQDFLELKMICKKRYSMQAFLGLLLFSVFFTTGASLRCETCTSYGKTCTGPWKKCDIGQDTCIVFLNEVTVGALKTLISVKGCSDSEGCDNGPIQLAFGQGISMRANAVCCKGDACESTFPHLPLGSSKPNGLQCPACYSVTDTCPEEMVPCRGSEDTCFYTVLHRYDGNYGFVFI